MDYTKDVSIDKDNLDKEWITLPSVYLQYAELEAKAKYEVNKLTTQKENINALLKRKYGELALRIRENPSSYGIVKATESTIEEAAITNFEYMQMLDNYYVLLEQLNTATYNFDMMSNAKWAFEVKKKALDGLTQLWQSNYFIQSSDNKVLREKATADVSKTVQTNLDTKLKTRRLKLD